MHPIIGIDNTGDIVPTGQQMQQQLLQQQQGQVPRGGNGLQIPTSMEQMKGQATTLYAGMKEKIAPTPPPQPPSNDPQGGPMLISGGGDAHDTDHVIGGKIFYAKLYIQSTLNTDLIF